MHSWSRNNLQWTKTNIVNDDLEEPAVIPKATTESSVEATQAVAKGRLPPQLDAELPEIFFYNFNCVSEDFLIDQAADGGAGQGVEDGGLLGLVMKSLKTWLRKLE